jgi:hypothetical protein
VHVEQDTTVAELAARLTHDVTLCFLPWLDSMTDEASIVAARDVMVR